MLGTGVRCLQLQVLPPSALTIHHIPSGWFQFLFLLLSVLIERSWAGGYDRGTIQPWHLSAAAGRGVPPPLPPPSPHAAEAATTCCRACNRWRGGRQGHCHKEGKQHHLLPPAAPAGGMGVPGALLQLEGGPPGPLPHGGSNIKENTKIHIIEVISPSPKRKRRNKSSTKTVYRY